MIEAEFLLDELAARGVTELIGVPCSYLTPLINRAASGSFMRYLPATQEGEAVAVASGSWLAGDCSAVIGQNSGLGNMVNPLTSLNYPHRIPVPVLVTWRGEPGRPDEPQHQLLGAITPGMLSLLRTSYSVLPTEEEELIAVLDDGWTQMGSTELPHAFIMLAGTVKPASLREPEPPTPVASRVVSSDSRRDQPPRVAALECLLGVVPANAAIIATTGKTSRELFTLADRPQHFYLVGAMGSAAAVGLGVARHSQRPVIVVDGDGSILMRLGTMALVGAEPAARLVHVLLDNQVHDSTGGQRSLASGVRFPSVAAACGYRRVYDCHDLSSFDDAVKAALVECGPSFIYLRIRPGSMSNLGRPTMHPANVARRFREFLTGDL
jgi:phosphonopyruvate decarboxylase